MSYYFCENTKFYSTLPGDNELMWWVSEKSSDPIANVLELLFVVTQRTVPQIDGLVQ